MTRNARNLATSAVSFVAGLFLITWTWMLADRSALSEYTDVVPELRLKAAVAGAIGVALLAFAAYLWVREVLRVRAREHRDTQKHRDTHRREDTHAPEC